MRRFFAVVLTFATVVASAFAAEAVPRAASTAEIALLKDAMKGSAQDTEHWAYTETTRIQDKKGKKFEETIVRFDPSKPYAEQYTPLKIDGKPELLRAEGGDQAAQKSLFDAGRRALLQAQNAGEFKKLPADKYGAWKVLNVVFTTEKGIEFSS